MIRHYLPSIAALIVLVFVVIFTSFSPSPSAVTTLQTQSVSAQGNVCSNQTTGSSVEVKVETWTPTREGSDAIPNGGRLNNGEAPAIVERICCGGCYNITLYSKGAELFRWVTCGPFDSDIAFPGHGFPSKSSVGADTFGLFADQIVINQPDTSLTGTFIKYNIKTETKTLIQNLSDTSGVVSIGKLKDLVPLVDNSNQSDNHLKSRQIVTVSVSGPVKAGIGNVDSNVLTTENFNIASTKNGTTFNFNNNFGNEELFVCKDALGNNKICDSQECNAAVAPLCSDGKDNDNDKLIDFPSDKGCSSADDGDETDPPPPPINRNITLKRSPKPTVIIQPILKDREVLTFDTSCTTCTITTTPDPSQFVGGSQQANAGFIIVAALINASDHSVSYTIVGSGDIIQDTKLFNAAGQEYTGVGELPDTQYPASFLADQDNYYNIKVRSGTQLEDVRMQSLLLPSTDSTPVNGSQHYYLLLGEDSNGKKHLLISKGRHWDLTTLADANMTPEPFYSFFLNRGDLSKCIQGLQTYPKAATLLSTPASFQIFLDLLTLCQR